MVWQGESHMPGKGKEGVLQTSLSGRASFEPSRPSARCRWGRMAYTMHSGLEQEDLTGVSSYLIYWEEQGLHLSCDVSTFATNSHILGKLQTLMLHFGCFVPTVLPFASYEACHTCKLNLVSLHGEDLDLFFLLKCFFWKQCVLSMRYLGKCP